MKKLLVSFAIVFELIVYIDIVDGRELNRYNCFQTDQAMRPAVNREITVSAIEAKIDNKVIQAETNSMTETKATSITELPPLTGTKPATNIMNEARLVTETTLSDRQCPVAVPVLSPDEAIKANKDALALRKKEGGTETKLIKRVTEAKTKEKLLPAAVPVLTMEEALKANKDAIRFQRNNAIAKYCQKIGMNSNRIHVILSLLPLLFIFDVMFFKRNRNRKGGTIREYISLSRRIRILFSVSLLTFGILIFVPWSVYFGNSLQFPFIFQDFVNWNLRVLTFSIIGACFVLLLIPPKISDYFVAVIAGLGLCVYIQAMFMNQHLGSMDGSEPEWSEHRFFGTINIIVWIIIIFAPIILKRMIPISFSKIISATAGVVLLLELLATVSMLFSANQNVWTRTDTFFVDGSKQFQLSKDKNVIVLIMDTLSSTFVERNFERYPETKTIVKDFIWYPDARSNYYKTYPSIIHELTGTFVPAPANTFYDLHDEMWHSPSAKSFYKQIKSAGYDSRLYLSLEKHVLGPADNYHEYFSNVVARDIMYKINYNRIHICLAQMSGYSFAPYLLKRYFFYSFDFSDYTVQKQVLGFSPDKVIPYTNNDFLKKLQTSRITSDADKPTFSVYFTDGAHRPWVYDEKCNKVKEEYDTPDPTTRGCFYILSELIRFLKEANIYDNTAIFLMSDHGGKEVKYATPFDMTIMFKPFHENKDEITIDYTKIQSIDILPTLLMLSCGNNAIFKDFEGFTPSNIPSERIRKVYRFLLDKSMPSVDSDLDQSYPGAQALEEYILDNPNTFKFGFESKSFVRLIPLIKNPKTEIILEQKLRR